ncbi:hypothetical protein ACRTEE_23305, partial [Vibrio alginolyticus]|uniref:hypothetical protein n=1 Tax=Vibrio alginolyticus TaxID=663 RepID=UPI003D7EC956
PPPPPPPFTDPAPTDISTAQFRRQRQMCIRDRLLSVMVTVTLLPASAPEPAINTSLSSTCLLYTSDADDETARCCDGASGYL